MSRAPGLVLAGYDFRIAHNGEGILGYFQSLRGAKESVSKYFHNTATVEIEKWDWDDEDWVKVPN